MKKLFGILSCCFLTYTAHTQTIEWEYTVQDSIHTSGFQFWVDDNGNGYYNIHRYRPEEAGSGQSESFLLKLDQHGRFAGSVTINRCRNTRALYPMGRNRFVSSGPNCITDTSRYRQVSIDTRIYNRNGKLLKVGDAFPGASYGAVCQDEEVTFFSKKTDKRRNSYVSIGRVAKDATITYDSISLSPIQHETMETSVLLRLPVQPEGGPWVIPYYYGNRRRKLPNGRQRGGGIVHGLIMGVANNEILWTYPDTLDAHYVTGISARKNRLAIVRSSAWLNHPKMFALLDTQGNELKRAMLEVKSVKDIALADSTVIVLERERIRQFDFSGKLLAEFDFAENGLKRPWDMQLVGDNAVIFNAQRGKNVVIIKLQMGEIKEEKAPLEATPAISYATVEETGKETMSIAVYPNPASINITFQVDQLANVKNGFSLQIFNTAGQLIHEAFFEDTQHEVYLDQMPRGTYYYKIAYRENADQHFISGKFIKT